MLACAVACVAASASAYFLLKSQRAPVARS
jgi:hypothetical protein